jgi:hypothetical protein
MIKIITKKQHGTVKIVKGSTLTAIYDGILDLRFNDVGQTIYAIDTEGVATTVLTIKVMEKSDDGPGFRLYDKEGKQIG